MRKLVVVAHNLRSTHNVGSLFRTADGLGIEKLYLTGYTPYPASDNDDRLPYVAQKTSKQISKTALGAEQSVSWQHNPDITAAIRDLKEEGYRVVALEQTSDAIQLPTYRPPKKLALIIGRETEGIEPEVLAQCDEAVEIPMFGNKESFNVVQAAAMALYYCRFMI